MMNKTVALAIVAAAIVAAGLVLAVRGPLASRIDPAGSGADSVWYHASDVVLLGRTNRPQLVEFFHPG